MCCNLYIGTGRVGPGPLPPNSLNDGIVPGSGHSVAGVPTPIYVRVRNAGTTSPASVVTLYYFPPGTAVARGFGTQIGTTAAAHPNFFVYQGYYAWASFLWSDPPFANTAVTFMAEVVNAAAGAGCSQQVPAGDPVTDPLTAVQSIYFHEGLS